MISLPLTRGLSLPLTRGLSLALPSYTMLDIDAQAYVTDVTTAGATVSDVQKEAIDLFVMGEKTASRWTIYKRFYLPIWGVAAANAICMVSLTSGSFVGGVTHNAGYVQSDGITGYFDLGVSSSGLGHTTSSASLFYLAMDSIATKTYIGAANDTILTRLNNTSSTNRFNSNTTVFNCATVVATARGVTIGNRVGDNLRVVTKRLAGYVQSPVISKPADASMLTQSFYAMCYNYLGTATNITTSRLGAYGVGMSFPDVDLQITTIAIRELWETCTGLTLP